VLQLGESDHGRTVSLQVGDVLRVTLPENAGTGYRWGIARCDAGIVVPQGSQAAYPTAGGAVGSGGEVTFSFQGHGVGNGEIVLKNRRSWEGDAPALAEWVLHLSVHA